MQQHKVNAVQYMHKAWVKWSTASHESNLSQTSEIVSLWMVGVCKGDKEGASRITIDVDYTIEEKGGSCFSPSPLPPLQSSLPPIPNRGKERAWGERGREFHHSAPCLSRGHHACIYIIYTIIGSDCTFSRIIIYTSWVILRGFPSGQPHCMRY